jgi:hypothetical protein
LVSVVLAIGEPTPRPSFAPLCSVTPITLIFRKERSIPECGFRAFAARSGDGEFLRRARDAVELGDCVEESVEREAGFFLHVVFSPGSVKCRGDCLISNRS